MSDDPFNAVFGDIFPKTEPTGNRQINEAVTRIVSRYSKARNKANQYHAQDNQRMGAHWEGRATAYANAIEILKEVRQ